MVDDLRGGRAEHPAGLYRYAASFLGMKFTLRAAPAKQAANDGDGSVRAHHGQRVKVDGCSMGEPTNAWTINGQPLRHLPHAMSDDLASGIARSEWIALRDAFPPLPTDPAALDAISTPVEQIKGAVLLLSASDDQM